MASSMAAFRERFRDETYFKKPLDRGWDIPALKRFVKDDLPKLGGKVTKKTAARTWKKVSEGYEEIMYDYVSTLMSKGKDPALANSMLAAMGAAPGARGNLGDGFMFWTKDRTGDINDAALQAEFNAMSVQEQNCADWLQKLNRGLNLYFVDRIVDAKMRSMLMAELARLRASNTDFEWKHAKDLVVEQLQSFDVNFLTNAVASMRREDDSTLLEWVQMFESIKAMCTKSGVTYPNSHWCEKLLGQVTARERAVGKFKQIPKNEAAKATFSVATFSKEVAKVKGNILGDFKASGPGSCPAVVEHCSKLLVEPGSNARNRRSGNGAKKDDAPWKYCDSCRKKHAKGKHTAAGRRAYKKSREATVNGTAKSPERTGGRNNTDNNVKRRTNTRAGAGKCNVCRKKHYPYCKLPKGTCFVCKKIHQPFCKRAEESNATETVTQKAGLSQRQKRKIAAMVVANMDSLFTTETETFASGKSDVCRARLEVYDTSGHFTKVIIAPDTVSSIAMAAEKLLHNVYDRRSGPIRVSGGSTKLDKRGCLLIPHRIRGSAPVPAFAAEPKSLPNGCDALLSKLVNSALQISTDAHCDLEVTEGATEADVIFRSKPLKEPLTHTVLGHDGEQHLCRLDKDFTWGRAWDKPPVTLICEIAGKDKNDMRVIQFADGSHSVVRASLLSPQIFKGGDKRGDTVPESTNATSEMTDAEVQAYSLGEGDGDAKLVSVVIVSNGLVAVAWNNASKTFWLPTGKVGAGTMRESAADVLYEQTGIREKEMPGPMVFAGSMTDPDGCLTNVFAMAIDDPRHAPLRPEGEASSGTSWARWVPIKVLLVNLEGTVTGSSGEGTDRAWLPLRFKNMPSVQAGVLLASLRRAVEAVDAAANHKGGAPPGWKYGSAVFFMSTSKQHEENMAVEQAAKGKCVYPPCDLPVAMGMCPKQGGAKQACSQEHYDLAKALGLTALTGSSAAEPQVQPGKGLAAVQRDKQEPFAVTKGDGCVVRLNNDECDAMLEAWKQILILKCRKNGVDPKSLRQWETGMADCLSIFDGPSGNFNRTASETGLYAMPPVDVLAKVPCDISNDVHYAWLMVGILTQKPTFVLLAPPCGAWTQAMRFNKNKPKVMQRIREMRKEQTKMMHRVHQLLKAVFAYGGHAMIENPRYSEFWKQTFVGDLNSILPATHSWRNVDMNMCRVGSMYSKATRFRTTAPPEVTKHMELLCNHSKKHPPLTGRGPDGKPRTKAASAYTSELVAMLVMVAAMIAGIPTVISNSGFTGDVIPAADSFAAESLYWDPDGCWETADGPDSVNEWLEFGWEQTDVEECYLAQSKLRLYWDRVKDLPTKPRSGHTDINFNPDCPKPVQKRVEVAVGEMKGIFNDGQKGMPRAARGGAVHIRLKADAKPRRCPEPVWGHGAKRRVLTKWAEEKLATGEFVPCPECEWASRPHIALKPKRGSAKDADDFDIRVCGDYVYVNSQTVKLQANAPNVPYQLEKAAGKRRYWYTDQDRQYNQWQLDKESSFVCAIWTPLGLIRPTRLQFGLKNAGTVAQGAVRVAREKHLSQETKKHSINVADDFNGFCDSENVDGEWYDDWNGLADSFIEHLEMAQKENWSLKASKTYFGYPESQFFGYTLNEHGSRAAEHNLTPIEQMVAPTDVKMLRRVIGLFNVHRNQIPNFGTIARPLHALTGKKEWKWTKVEDEAFEALRAAALTNKVLAAPDFTKQFSVECDASEFGKGWVIYQLIDENGEDTLDNRAVIKYGAKAWGNSMKDKPPYYTEADCLITAIADGQYYSDATPYPLRAKTDQAPLRYIKTCAKGPVTAWRIENISECEYEVYYNPGENNPIADCLS